jgi:lysophospholipase L1-like esterase
MKRRALCPIVFPALVALATVACSSSDSPGGAGGSGSGGSASSGGKPGSGGAATGGAVGSGGAGLGGVVGSGGRTAGASGSGGTAGKGGATTVDAGTAPDGNDLVTGGAGGKGGSATGGTTSGSGGSGSGGAGPGSGGRVGADAGTSATGGGPGGDGGTSRADAGSSGPETGTSYNPCPTDTACKILPLGDSITEGFGYRGSSSDPDNQGGYRIELFRQAVTDGKNITFVGAATNGPTTVANKTFPRNHEGHGGYTIDTDSGHSGISGNITNSAMSSYKPHIVLLMIGTNDINGNVDQANAPTRLGKLIDAITGASSSTLVVVASIIPSQTDGTNKNFQTYNAAIPGLVSKAAAAGKHVVFLDNWAAFSADTSYKTKLMIDNLHPNDAGYAVLGQSWYKAISAYLPAAH